MKQFTTILTGLGLPQTDMDTLNGMTEEQLKDFKGDEYVNKIRGQQKDALSNDPDFLNSIPDDKIPKGTKEKIEKGQYARFQNELIEVATKQLGLEDKDLTEADRKSIKQLTKKIAEGYLTKHGNVEGLKKMQNDLSEMTSKLEAKDSEWQEKMNSEIEKNNGASNAKILKFLVKDSLRNIDGLELSIPVNYALDPTLAKISQKYAIIVDENDELKLMNKENPKLEAMDGTKKITYQEALKKVLLEEKIATEKTADDGKEKKQGEKKRVIINSENNKDDVAAIPSYVNEKLAANLALEKKG